MSLTCLPDDALRTIAQHVDLLDVCSLAQVCSATRGAFNIEKLALSRFCFDTMYCQPMALLDRCIQTIQSTVDVLDLLDTAVYVDREGVYRLEGAHRLHPIRSNCSLLMLEMNKRWLAGTDWCVPRTFSRTVVRECRDIMMHLSLVVHFQWERDRKPKFFGTKPTPSQIDSMWKQDYFYYRSKFEKHFNTLKMFRAECAHLILPPPLPADVLAK